MSGKPKKKSAKKNKINPRMTTRRGIILIAVLAVLILVVNLISASYSWFAPGTANGSGAKYKSVVNARSESCSFHTYSGHKTASYSAAEGAEDEYRLSADGSYRHDQVVYESVVVSGTYTLNPNDTLYFKTDIINSDRNYPSVISLYSRHMAAGLQVCVNYPSNSVRTVKSTETDDYYLIRNAYVKVYEDNDVDGPGLLVIEWSVKNTTNATISGFDPRAISGDSGLYLMYN